MKAKQWLKTVLIIIFGMLITGFVVIPLPYYIELPGATIDLEELITVNDKEDEGSGSFSFASVGIRQATGFLALKVKMTPSEELISEEGLTGGVTNKECNQMQQYYMDSSQSTAIEQVLKLADKPYKMELKGVYVISVEKTSNFFGKFLAGDTVTKVDGKSFQNTEAFMDYVKSQKVGRTIEISYLHNGEEKTTPDDLIELPIDKKAGVGITLTDHTEIESDTDARTNSGPIDRPSVGLVFTLEIYEQVTGKNLRHGKQIAGTGTINSKGEVGRIGGIGKKVASADKAGVEIFFAPDDTILDDVKKEYPEIKTNYEEAKAAAKKLNSSIKIVPVETVQEALDYLEKMK